MSTQLTGRRLDEHIGADIFSKMTTTTRRYWILMAVLGGIVAWAAFALLVQVRTGMGVAGIRRPVFWGLYIATFVFWIGMSHAGTMISAILRLSHANWRLPITRAAEAMTLISLTVAGLFPLIHLGRITLFYWLLPLPNQQGLWPNYRSPLVWDAMAIMTYMTGSTLFLFVALIPDLAFLRDRFRGVRRKIYSWLSLGWAGTDHQWHWLERAMLIMAVVIIPVAVSVHSIVSWDFGMTLVPGWHTTIFAPYFVLGAIFSGTAAVITLLALLRWVLGLESYLRPYHFDQLGKLLLTFSLLWFYFNISEILTMWYGNEAMEAALLRSRFEGPLSPWFLTMMVLGFLVPVIYLSVPRWRRSVGGIFIVSLLVNVAMYIERVLIVVPSLINGRFPFSWEQYRPTWVELSIVTGSLALFVLLFMTFIKLVPVISIWEYQAGVHSRRTASLAGQSLPAYLAPHARDDYDPAFLAAGAPPGDPGRSGE